MGEGMVIWTAWYDDSRGGHVRAWDGLIGHHVDLVGAQRMAVDHYNQHFGPQNGMLEYGLAVWVDRRGGPSVAPGVALEVNPARSYYVIPADVEGA